MHDPYTQVDHMNTAPSQNTKWDEEIIFFNQGCRVGVTLFGWSQSEKMSDSDLQLIYIER